MYLSGLNIRFPYSQFSLGIANFWQNTLYFFVNVFLFIITFKTITQHGYIILAKSIIKINHF